MQLPFSVAQFFQVIRDYNHAVWPAPVALNALAVAAVLLLIADRPWSSRLIWAILALLWAWSGAVYQLAFFTRINPVAYAFGALFLGVALHFAWLGARPDPYRFAPARNVASGAGAGLAVYALIVYPIWASVAGHAYPDLPTFGLPCPTTIFTIGMLAFVADGRPRRIFGGPALWAAVGSQAAIGLDVAPDFGLGVAGLVAICLALRRRGPRAHAAPA